MIIDHTTSFEDHQLLGKVQSSDRSHFRLQLLAELVFGCLLIAHGNVVGCGVIRMRYVSSGHPGQPLTFRKNLELLHLANGLCVERNSTLVKVVTALDQVLYQLAGI